MNSQVLPLLQNELAKASRRKLPAFGVFAMVLVSVIVYFIAGKLVAADANGWGYLSFAMQVIFADVGPIFVIVFSAMLVAEETGTGTIRSVLVAPVQRWEVYLAKALAGGLYMMVLSATALLCSVALAKVHYEFGPVADAVGVVYSRNQALRQLLFGYLLSWIPLGTLVMYGLLISTLVRSPGAAVAVGISSMVLIDLTKHLVGLDPYIFTRYIGYSWETLKQIANGMDFQWRPELWRMLRLCGVSGVITFGAGLLVFVRQDLNK